MSDPSVGGKDGWEGCGKQSMLLWGNLSEFKNPRAGRDIQKHFSGAYTHSLLLPASSMYLWAANSQIAYRLNGGSASLKDPLLPLARFYLLLSCVKGELPSIDGGVWEELQPILIYAGLSSLLAKYPSINTCLGKPLAWYQVQVYPSNSVQVSTLRFGESPKDHKSSFHLSWTVGIL